MIFIAERRMFAKTIIDSDLFTDMPTSARLLYYDLGMRADDEGFVNSPKKIMRATGASQDDLAVLISKQFIIPFDSGVVVIKHWKIHNYIRNDRLKSTAYTEEKNMLTVDEKGEYSLYEEPEVLSPREIAYNNGSLPYSFNYKIARYFDGKRCPVCGCTMSKSGYSNTAPTVQHNIPVSKGGTNDIENISVICRSCNCSIGNTPTDGLNNAEVIEAWDKILDAEANGIDWFYDPSVLDGQMSDTCQPNVSVGKVRLGKDRLGKDRTGQDRIDSSVEAEPEYLEPLNYNMEVLDGVSEEGKRYEEEVLLPAEEKKHTILPAEELESTITELAPVESVILNDNSEWIPTVEEYEEYKRLYPNVDIDQEFRKMHGWCKDNPKKRKTRTGVKRFVGGWLSREQDKPRMQSKAPSWKRQDKLPDYYDANPDRASNSEAMTEADRAEFQSMMDKFR